MSNSIVIERISKEYRIGERLRYRTLRDSMTSVLAAPFRGALALARGRAHIGVPHRHHERIWALRDVSFDVADGQVMGILGRNGAGKSTLLKVLTRITEPTSGQATIRGRVGSLLEVGTGFHPELTGRDNVFLNGTILGMRRSEIRRKFDEIVEFSGVEKFIDTPVKRYSSGMYVRLAFAVAAHMEPDVLLVDEVLAVGDAAFQKKCLGKISEVTRQGRTVIFVSHNMAAIRDICPTAVWLEQGQVEAVGPSADVIDQYLRTVNQPVGTGEQTFEARDEFDFQVVSVRLTDESGMVRGSFEVSEPPVVELTCDVRETVPGLYGYVVVNRSDGTMMIETDSHDVQPNPFDSLSPGRHVLRIGLPPRVLGHGTYSIYVSFSSMFATEDSRVHSPREIGTFTIDDFTSRRGNQRGGVLSSPLLWEVAE